MWGFVGEMLFEVVDGDVGWLIGMWIVELQVGYVSCVELVVLA